MITKADMEGRVRRERQPKGEHGKQQTWLWACSAVKGVCNAKMHPRINCATHGSKEEAERCNRRAELAKLEESNDR